MISALFLLPGSKGVPCREAAGEGAEFWAFPASNTISMTLLLVSRLFAEIARVYPSDARQNLAIRLIPSTSRKPPMMRPAFKG